MKRRTFAVLFGVPLTVFVASASDAANTQQKPGETRAPTAPIVAKPVLKIRAPTAMRVINANMEIGELKELSAEVSGANKAPLAGKTVTFALISTQGTVVRELGSAVTQETGWAKLKTGFRDVAPGQYAVRATFAGDADLLASSGDGSFVLMKAPTRCVLGPSEDGAATARLEFQKTDWLKSVPETERYEVVVNGVVTKSSTNWSITFAQLSGNGPWKVSMVYKGGALYHPCAFERTYTNARETTYGGPH